MNNTKAKLYPESNNHENLKALLVRRIPQLGSFRFEDDTWYFSKKHKNSSPKSDYTVWFHQVPKRYKEWVKYYVLLSQSSVHHTTRKCYLLARFLKFMDQSYSGVPLAKINRDHINAFEFKIRLFDSPTYKKQQHYAVLQDFFMTLTDFPDMPNVVPTKNINPFRFIKEKGKRKSLPRKVIRAWDRAMKDETLDIPLEFRTLYWLLRSFPNRITELLSMKRDCIKSFYSEYVIRIPTFKQSGGYEQAEFKMIPVAYSGHGKYVIDLIRRLQKQTNELLSKHPVKKRTRTDLLFIVRHWNYVERDGKPDIKFWRSGLINWERAKINDLFRQLTPILDLRDHSGELITPTTHQFRHNAVTDRLYTVGYTTEQVRRLTGHKNEAMTKYYTHQLIEKHKAIHLGISGLRKPNDSPVEFRGKIMNLDERTTKQLSKDQKRYLTWEANDKKGVGICSDIAGCNPKGTSVHFECYACDWFVPKLEYYDDYRAEHAYWQDVIERTAKDPKRAAHFENAVRNASYVERILKICENGVEHFKEDQLQEKLKNHHHPPDWE